MPHPEPCCHRADLLSLNVFLTPAGMRDEGGVVQPAYLNFDALLLSAPANSMKVGLCSLPNPKQPSACHSACRMLPVI